MEIPLNLTHHCIETASKREYERMVRQCFKISDTDNERMPLEKKISALIYFLEKADFSDLRNQCNKIYSDKKDEKTADLIIPKNFKDMYVGIDKKTLYPIWKNK
ncbi:hypothetical protein [Desulfobacula toluolica]|uniref:Conserved uncharacterized protein n=1 Tax=Desulfobacula toluolica (strain DSM 7467 / Tol2) TaxID=651182 RepID=K0NFH4_DESTT|nr:hypothetical protein [Desulfobacula toluolica]CCK79871.1 conserved uncharacterized protein [Desulfobacula toluolica Tol2]